MVIKVMTPQNVYLPNKMPILANTPITTKSFITLRLAGKCFSKLLNTRKYATLAISETARISARLIGGREGRKIGCLSIVIFNLGNRA